MKGSGGPYQPDGRLAMHPKLTEFADTCTHLHKRTPMPHADLTEFLRTSGEVLAKGPIAVVLVEDDVEVATTLRHCVQSGFATILALMPASFDLPADLQPKVHRITYDVTPAGAAIAAMNRIIAAAPGQWIHYCYNAEYLFFPFCETRSVGEMLAFHTEERRDAMLTYVVDLYADDLEQFPDAVSLDHAFLDQSGYYALARQDPANPGQPKERQHDFFGGLRWRFEEHVPFERRKIDRIGLFRAKAGLELREDHTLSDEEMNTYACPWHHNITAAICSFRTAKALKSNPGSRDSINSFKWHNSTSFEWHSRQLLDLGLMEPGQWF